jgi:hypothetical protein
MPYRIPDPDWQNNPRWLFESGEPVTMAGGVGGVIPGTKFPNGIDREYRFHFDVHFLTAALVAAGYRPYRLHRADNGLLQTVWAQPEVQLLGWYRVKLHGVQAGDRVQHKVLPNTVHRPPYERIARYGAGEVAEIPISNLRVSINGTVVLVADEDGGYTVELGRQKEVASLVGAD